MCMCKAADNICEESSLIQHQIIRSLLYIRGINYRSIKHINYSLVITIKIYKPAAAYLSLVILYLVLYFSLNEKKGENDEQFLSVPRVLNTMCYKKLACINEHVIFIIIPFK